MSDRVLIQTTPYHIIFTRLDGRAEKEWEIYMDRKRMHIVKVFRQNLMFKKYMRIHYDERGGLQSIFTHKRYSEDIYMSAYADREIRGLQTFEYDQETLIQFEDSNGNWFHRDILNITFPYTTFIPQLITEYEGMFNYLARIYKDNLQVENPEINVEKSQVSLADLRHGIKDNLDSLDSLERKIATKMRRNPEEYY